MVKIEAIFRPSRFEAVKNALAKIGIQGMTISEVKGCGKQKGIIEHYRGSEYEIFLHPKVKFEIVTSDDKVEKLIDEIRQAACTGEIGDGKIFVYPVAEVIRLRTGERGETVL
ncbi:MAG TPA: P-II family nitrogen regulator [Bacillota bacterium]|nr:P-II family nitrogen regulator [Bacillota bacterium]